jgi:hypothetical protein
MEGGQDWLGGTRPWYDTKESRHNNTYETRPLILRARLCATKTLQQMRWMMHKSGGEGWEDPTRERAWNESEAVRLLQEAGEWVAGFEATGARMTQRERYHACLVAAHDARDMDHLPPRSQRVRKCCPRGTP